MDFQSRQRMDRSVESLLRERLAEVNGRLAETCRRAGRQRSEVTLVAVTKTISAEVAGALPHLGVTDLGESRPQQLWKKAAAVAAPICWHLVGHLQRNKIERTLPLVHLIHSVDSLRLLEALDREAVRIGRTVEVLLEVNMSKEPQKHGLPSDDVAGLVPSIARLQSVHVRGLMTMAALADAERCRPTFAALRELRDRLLREWPPPHSLAQLSMGMSNDYEVAVEEGATLVRLGTALFHGLEK
jgi:pyridoxal phosphate enzyme (YggS family)